MFFTIYDIDFDSGLEVSSLLEGRESGEYRGGDGVQVHPGDRYRRELRRRDP